jgi:hypothetical protein
MRRKAFSAFGVVKHALLHPSLERLKRKFYLSTKAKMRNSPSLIAISQRCRGLSQELCRFLDIQNRHKESPLVNDVLSLTNCLQTLAFNPKVQIHNFRLSEKVPTISAKPLDSLQECIFITNNAIQEMRKPSRVCPV